MAAPNNAAIQRQAKIAQAQADQAAAEAQQASARKQAEFARETSVVQAQYKAEVDKAQAEAAQAGPLAQANAQLAVINAQAELAQQQAQLRQQQLVSEVVKPAEAEAERIRILALADAERTRIQAEAAASNNRVALDQLLINQLPLIVKEAAAGLAGANVSVLNGADGLGEIAAGLVSQGMTILDAVRKGMPGQASRQHRQRAGGERPGGAGQPGRFGPRLAATAERPGRQICRFADVLASPAPAGTPLVRLAVVATATTAIQPQDRPAAERAPAPPSADRRAVALAAVYYLLAALAVTLWLWRDPASRTVAGNPYDADQLAWFFRYDATAIAHGHLPALVTTAMNAPQGVSVMWNTFMLLPGALLAPVTLLLGPQTSAHRAHDGRVRRVRDWPCSSCCGAGRSACRPRRSAGRSTASPRPLLHSAIGHYDLQFAVLPPLIIHVGLRLATGRTSAVRGGLGLGLLVTAQLFITEEILAVTAIAGVVLVAVLAASRPRAVPAAVRRVAAGLAVAACVTAVLAGYPLWVQFFGPLRQHGSPFMLDYFKNDLSSFVVPSSYQLFHTAGSAAAASRYQGQLPEYLGYLGWPLLVVLVLAAIACWRRLPARAAAVACLVLGVFSLGGTLLFGGHHHPAIKLPWYWLQGLPLLESALPDRFSLVADGAAAALLAFAVDAAVPVFAAFAARCPPRLGLPRLAAGWRPVAVVMAAAVLAILPIVPRPLPAAAATPRAGRLVGGVRRAAATRLGQRARGAGPDVHLHRAAALAGRHGRTALAGRRVLHGPGAARARLHRRDRHAPRGPLPERHVDLLRRRPAPGAGGRGPAERPPGRRALRAGQVRDRREDAASRSGPGGCPPSSR